MEFRKITDQGMGRYRYKWHASSLRWKQILHSHVSCFSLLALLLNVFCLSLIFSFSLVTGMSQLGDMVYIACHVSVIVQHTLPFTC